MLNYQRVHPHCFAVSIPTEPCKIHMSQLEMSQELEAKIPSFHLQLFHLNTCTKNIRQWHSLIIFDHHSIFTWTWKASCGIHSHRIHVWYWYIYIYTNIKGVSWWDPCYHSSIHGSVMGFMNHFKSVPISFDLSQAKIRQRRLVRQLLDEAIVRHHAVEALRVHTSIGRLARIHE